MLRFSSVFLNYLGEILPALAVGFFFSGLIHQFIPGRWVEKALGRGGPGAVFSAALVGTILPICCWGSLPVAVSLHKKGSRLGPVLAFLVATPATSVTSLLVTFRLLGARFMFFEFFAVIVMGVVMGIIANKFIVSSPKPHQESCSDCRDTGAGRPDSAFFYRIKLALKFAFYDLPKEIGLEMFVGIILASLVASVAPIGEWVQHSLTGTVGYAFALVFSLVMYICATATVPLVEAFIGQGLSAGAGMVLLLAGPITSYGTILVLMRKGVRVIILRGNRIN